MVFVLSIAIANAQAPQKFSYQAAIRNNSNTPIANTAVSVKISLLKDSATGAVVYSETHAATTNANGIVTLQIGGGNKLSGNFSAINWGSSNYYVKTETDPTGKSNYVNSGTAQLLSVPYALYAGASGTAGTPGKDGVSVTNTKVLGDSLFITLSNGLTLNAGNVRGVKGIQGVQGLTGATGAKGDSGARGLQGIQGFTGATGAQGIQGLTGSTGAKGDSGVRGLQGIQGIQGLKGDKGDQGIQGIQGLTGATGLKGDSGARGLQGIQGIQGLKGDQGIQGIQGLTGAIGVKGDSGARGLQGIQGIQGLTGAIGAQGIQGLKGDQGIQGIQGLTGATGVKGDSGARGLQGIQGLTGATGAKGDSGARGLQGIQGIQGLTGATGVQGIQGLKGDKGDQGIQGFQGLTGVKGDSGARGLQGIQGIQGLAGVTGAQGIQGLKGDQGIQGIQGLIGAIGAAGKDGVSITNSKVTGDSLFITLSNGQMLNAGYVRGATGTQGIQGIKGDSGINGKTILNGTITPINALGSVGDFYINTANNTIYGPKTSLGWGTGTSLTATSSSGVLPSVTTKSANVLGYSSVIVNANVTNTGGEFLFGKGVCIAITPSPSVNNSYISSTSNGTGIYSIQFDSLLPNTTYYVRAFASTSVGTAYGSQLSFITPTLALATIQTNTIINISTNSALGNGNITDDGGTFVTNRGICWATTINPTTANNSKNAGTGIGSFTGSITGLTQGTTYYVRAFATNSVGTSYGTQQTFTTVSIPLASVISTSANSISYTTAMVGGNVVSDGGFSVTSRGVCWDTAANPTIINNNATSGLGIGTYSISLAGLMPNTVYYYRAYAINGGGIVYGTKLSFTTNRLTVPSVSTNSVIGISTTTATSGGNVSDDGGSAVTARGVCYSTNPNPTLSNSILSGGAGTGIYNSNITGLVLSTTYYIRAYATNTQGTAYGNELSFTTLSVLGSTPSVPIVGTGKITLDSEYSAIGNGYVTIDGGSTVTERGLCWSDTTVPTIAAKHSTDGKSGLGYYSVRLNDLRGCGVNYNVRAYATNSFGTGYGYNLTVQAGTQNSLTTKPVINITTTTAESGGDSIQIGDCSVNTKGVCWASITNPTVFNNFTSEGTGKNAFTSTITGLVPNNTYYVRAYVTTSLGTTGYGSIRTIKTDSTNSLYIGQSYAGGIIFYLDATGTHGLVANDYDQSAYWGCIGTFIGTGTAIGTGASNTAGIIAACNDNSTAASLCNGMRLNGYSDWFLPSIDELNLVYKNLYLNGISYFSNRLGYYLSSSEISGNPNANDAWIINFTDGGIINIRKDDNIVSFRAVRRF